MSNGETKADAARLLGPAVFSDKFYRCPLKRTGVLDMAAYFAGTLTAFKKGVTKMPIAAAIKNIENWEERLQDVELTGCRAILRDLAALKKHLQEDEPDGDRIRHLMAKLASQTVAISGKADSQHSEKIANLGAMLAEAAEAAEDDGDEPVRKSDDKKSRANGTDGDDGRSSKGNQYGRSSQDADGRKQKAGDADDDHDADGKFAKGNTASRSNQGAEDEGKKSKANDGNEDHDSDGKFARGNDAGRSNRTSDKPRARDDDADDSGDSDGRKSKVASTERSLKSDGDRREAQSRSK
jgi:hypothetical protein